MKTYTVNCLCKNCGHEFDITPPFGKVVSVWVYIYRRKNGLEIEDGGNVVCPYCGCDSPIVRAL